MPAPRGPALLTAVPLAVLVTLVAGRSVARAPGSAPWTGYLLTFAVASILAITLVPARPPVGPAEGPSCLVPSFGVLTSGVLLGVTEESLNVLLFVPLGVAVAWLDGRVRWAALAFAVALPWIVEGTQLAVPALGRACQGIDLTTNLLGLGIGLVLGFAARRLAGD